MEKKNNISENIRNIRESLGYSQEETASFLQMTQQAYSLIERQPEKASLTNLRKIASVLQVKVSTLIMEENNETQNISSANHCNIGFHQNISSSDACEMFINRLEKEILELKEVVKKSDFKKLGIK